jgi:hypothetical protein
VKGVVRNALLLVCVLAAASASVRTSVHAQAFGSVAGTVRDPNGDVVPRATVTLTNNGTNATRIAQASRDGIFQLTQILPGTYEVRAEASGFKTSIQKDVVVQVNTPLTLDLALDVGHVTETAEVVSGEETINRRDATIGNTFTETQVRQLPIEGRNVVDLLGLQPGVIKTATNNFWDDRTGAVNGARSDQSNVTLDGIDVNDQLGQYAFTSVVPVTLDSVQEFRVITANANADLGRSSGAQVALVTKSGANEFHGSLYEFHRNTVTTANSFFNNAVPVTEDQPAIERPKLLRNVFGASLGGPFIRDRFFFFVNYEGRRDAREDTVVRVVPSETLRLGIIRYLNTEGRIESLSPSQIAAIDPLGIGPNPAVLAYFGQYPLANDASVGDGLNTLGFRFQSPIHVNNNTYIARADYQINAANALFGRGNLADNVSNDVQRFPGGPPVWTYIDNSRGFALGYTSLVRSDLTNVLRYGLTRQGTDTGGASTGPAVYLGVDFLEPVTHSYSLLAPTHNITDDVAWARGNHTIEFGTNLRFTRIHVVDSGTSFPFFASNWSFLAGAGVDLVPGDVDASFRDAFRHALVASLGLLTQTAVLYQYDRGGNALPVGTPVERDFGADEYELYVQDTWKVRPNLIVTGGLRYSLYSPPWETNGLQVAPSIPLAEWARLRVENAARGIPANAAPDVTFDLAGPANDRRGYYDWDTNNFGPRASVAWSPGFERGLGRHLFGGPGRSAIRGGFGVFYDRIGSALASTFDYFGSVGLSTQVATPSLSLDASTAPRFAGFDALPPLPPAPPGGFPAHLPPGSFAITTSIDDSIRTPVNYLVNFSFARELPGGVAIEAAYIGRFGRNKLALSDLAPPVNLADPVSGQTWYEVAAILERWIATGIRVDRAPNLPYFENLFPGIGLDGRTSTQQAYLFARAYAPDWVTLQYELDFDFPSRFVPYAFFDDQYSALSAWRSNEDTSYNAGQLMVRKRFDRGVTFDFNYTYAKSIDLTSSAERAGPYGYGVGTGFVPNAFDPEQNRGVSDYDVTHSINANWLWELPVGRGRALLPDAPGWVDALAGGWQLAGILRATSGFPVSVGNGGYWPTNWNIAGWATATGSVRGETARRGDGPNLFPDPERAIESFRHTSAGQSGSRNILRGDGYFSLDLGLGKEFRMPWEGHRVQFRWEVLNATNTARFDVQTASLELTNLLTFGKYTGLLNQPRVMQFGLRYEF